ncbi:1-(5-phosphoribosyl)-5-[(5-phosphoribosylamino)methylideneamino] imidazole-4-carboxamide isomerase [Kytococcus aerolatus]|uniref:1-(5-phosphoribosyl)-5-[(5-phosphoribosylamino)methylideneamino] imidazole-4-carboxamide isomerase n=1 Tax=Kytococcus aerolatus TaxID=592308 RepID=A0A212U2P6_9MICO|nr:HisA/HisF-related TIM barrel protein [Kytococcus aerolatus]SNC72518.1 1-(5-phosphoribosyl)-5-[(5-phosphoribosylamino)methylideneamino] imidazole-4-carboxamide isomerase [Kytococcus aerolatus]
MRARVPLRLWAAVDLTAGRTAQADPGSPLAEPRAAVEHWVAQGARQIHLVDLDRAHGTGQNDALVREIVARAGVPVELSGGVLAPADVERALSWGATAVTVSSGVWADAPAALEWLREWDDRVQIGIDLLGERVVARGRRGDLGHRDELLGRIAGLGARRWVVASAAADGRRTGPDLSALRHAAERLEGVIVASGGVGSTGDLVQLSSLRGPHGPAVAEAILGASLYAGAVELGRSQDLLAEIAGPTAGAIADSAGVPWAGREVRAGEFDDDTGEVDPRLADPGQDDAALVEALGPARVFVALLAEEGADAADMAVAHVTTPEGWTALPVFTSADAVPRWRSEARPVPVRGAQAAQAAVEDGVEALVLDPGSTPRVVRPSMVSAAARGMVWCRPSEDPVVVDALRRLKEHPRVEGVLLRTDEQGALVVGIRGPVGETEAAGLVAEAVGDPEVRSRLDAVMVTPVR